MQVQYADYVCLKLGFAPDTGRSMHVKLAYQKWCSTRMASMQESDDQSWNLATLIALLTHLHFALWLYNCTNQRDNFRFSLPSYFLNIN